MYEVLFTTAAGARKRVHGFPKLGGALFAAAELLSVGQRSEIRTGDYLIQFRSDRIADSPEYPHPCGPQPAVSVQIVLHDSDTLVFDFNADSGDEAARWARRILGL